MFHCNMIKKCLKITKFKKYLIKKLSGLFLASQPASSDSLGCLDCLDCPASLDSLGLCSPDSLDCPDCLDCDSLDSLDCLDYNNARHVDNHFSYFVLMTFPMFPLLALQKQAFSYVSFFPSCLASRRRETKIQELAMGKHEKHCKYKTTYVCNCKRKVIRTN